ncbi:MAG: sigma-54 dependent transcriptional regulator, partial [Candidatus Eisenbacteria bacterium]
RMRRLHERVDRLETREERRRTLVGDGPSMQALRRTIAKVATTNATVLITGESGTGKELVARAIHAAGGRRDGPFVKVNCAAIPDDLIEAELFGSVRGAFTGADRTRDGRFLLADGGTILLDEIGDMSMRVQAKVLRVLQEGELERVGDSRTVVTDVRVLAATHRDLAREVTQGNFREDLFFRLNVLPIVVPPLRERIEDIPALCRHHLELAAIEHEIPRRTITPDAERVLQSLPLRGNVRELQNLLDRICILAEGSEITADDVRRAAPDPIGERLGKTPASDAPASGVSLSASTPSTRSNSSTAATASSTPGFQAKTLDPGPGTGAFALSPERIRELGGLSGARQSLERACIESCLDRTGGNVSEAARWLEIERSNLHKKMQSLGIEARPPRRGSNPQGGSS